MKVLVPKARRSFGQAVDLFCLARRHLRGLRTAVSVCRATKRQYVDLHLLGIIINREILLADNLQQRKLKTIRELKTCLSSKRRRHADQRRSLQFKLRKYNYRRRYLHFKYIENAEWILSTCASVPTNIHYITLHLHYSTLHYITWHDMT